jgi:hypothetical protein
VRTYELNEKYEGSRAASDHNSFLSSISYHFLKRRRCA